ncbi:hypothetical protein BDR22DRAFT_139596 [Usnea florida]
MSIKLSHSLFLEASEHLHRRLYIQSNHFQRPIYKCTFPISVLFPLDHGSISLSFFLPPYSFPSLPSPPPNPLTQNAPLSHTTQIPIPLKKRNQTKLNQFARSIDTILPNLTLMSVPVPFIILVSYCPFPSPHPSPSLTHSLTPLLSSPLTPPH